MPRFTFGKMLRGYRRSCTDPERGGKLTQERFLDLLSIEADIAYSHATASNWERGESAPRRDKRNIQVGIVKVLHDCGAIVSPEEANELLEAGNYRALDKEEQQWIFPDWEDGSANSTGDGSATEEARVQQPQKSAWQAVYRAVSDTMFHPDELGHQRRPEGANGAISWPYVLEQLVSRPLRHVTSQKILMAVLWTAVWLLSWQLTFPLLRWPFTSQAEAWRAGAFFAAGALLAPVGVGALSYTLTTDEFWQERGSSATARYLTYMGAFAGFHLGYFFVLIIMVLGYYAGVTAVSWLELLLSPAPILFSFVLADQVPFHYWLAFGAPMKLSAGDRAILLILILYSLLSGMAVAIVYPWLLRPEIGIPLSLTAIGLVALTRVAEGRIGRKLVPLLFVGLFAFLFLLAQGESILTIALITSVSAAVAVAVWRQRVQANPLTVLLLLALALSSGWLFSVNAQLPAWMVLASSIAVAGWRWQRGTLRLPPSLLAIMGVSAAIYLLTYRGYVSEIHASISLTSATAAFLWLELRRRH